MPTNWNSQIQFLSGRFLNNIHDAVAGGSAASGTGAAQILGQLGQKLELGEDDANKMSDPAIGTLHAGEYQYVQTGVVTQVPARGLIAYWLSESAYTVTPDKAGGGCVAGLYLTAQADSEFHFIQRAGVGSIKFKAAVTKATPASCDLIIGVSESSVGVGDVLADATALTSVEVRAVIGTAIEAPVGGQIKTVAMWERFRNT